MRLDSTVHSTACCVPVCCVTPSQCCFSLGSSTPISTKEGLNGRAGATSFSGHVSHSSGLFLIYSLLTWLSIYLNDLQLEIKTGAWCMLGSVLPLNLIYILNRLFTRSI